MSCACGIDDCRYPHCPQGDYARQGENGEVYFYPAGGKWFVDDERGVKIDGPYASYAELHAKWAEQVRGR